MSPEIERQLIDWGAKKRNDVLRFVFNEDCSLYFHNDGAVVFGSVRIPRNWKTLDDIKQMLDVFGVPLKKPMRWTIGTMPHEVRINGSLVAGFWKPSGAHDPEAAAEYVAWKNQREGAP